MSMSTRSGATGVGGRQMLPDKKPDRGAEPPSPDSPLRAGPLTRKRAASLRTDGPRIEDLHLSTPTDTSPKLPLDNGRDLICLCTPAPKVPRPRNAFILYRQHHQAQVVQQNPGLANPEISKIIGERWREEPDEHKEQWKRLAEEEKVRHQRQYPDYRYQPRRGGKTAAARAQIATSQQGEDPGRCPKCGGRYIATPRTPSTPFPYAGTPTRGTTPTAGSNNSGGSNMSFANPSPRVAETDHLRHGSQSGLREQQYRTQYQSYQPATHHHHHYQPRGNIHSIGEDDDMESPGQKRRRYDSQGGYPENSSYTVTQYPYGQQQPYQQALPHHIRQPPQQQLHRHPSMGGPGISSPAYPPQPGGPLPGPPQHGQRGSIGMAPPPRPGSVVYPPPPSSRRDTAAPAGAGFDESLRLPPLQTPTTTQTLPPPSAPAHHLAQSISPTSVGTAGPTSQLQQQRDRDTQARGVEAMIMSIPYLNKLKVLEKIAPPFTAPSAGSPSIETRGPVIAIEGAVPSLVRQVGLIVERALAGSGECAVRTWSSEDGKRESAEGGNEQQFGFATCLQTVTEWHGRSGEIVKHITTAPQRRESDVSMGSSGGEETKSTHGSASGEAARSSSVNTTASAGQQQGGPKRHGRQLLPVALLMDGFSLTISDRFACRVPIADSYAPVDHWQWMATLWRGIVGPDLVIYVRGAEEEEMARLQAVEMNGPDIMKVRVVVPPGGGGGVGEVVVGEKVERRLGFEVVEWVRNGSFKEGF